ncbi:MAG TPA: histidine phosphatase family protein [Planctomycetota bacterium]|jgi:phosphohistidine phosphatase SixA|nr:histidine phosphatase family protein [Planctomycetota bacterium]
MKHIFAISCLLFLSTSASTPQDDGLDLQVPQRAVTVIAVRHAEKATDDPRDPNLTEEGHERARSLARLLSHAGVTHLFSTPYRRTRDTLAPLVKSTGLSLIEYSARDLPSFVKQLSLLPAGSVAVVAGHSNTTPSLVLGLGGDIVGLETVRGRPSLDEAQYDRLFVTTVPGKGSPSTTLELRF